MKYAIVNYKGGVAKTSVAAGLGGALAKLGKKTLLVDLDPQGNLTKHVGVKKGEYEKSIYEVLLDRNGSVQDVAMPTVQENLFLAPSSRKLLNARVDLSERPNRDAILSRACKQLDEYFHFVVFDTPPDEGLLVVNAIYASDYTIIPTFLSNFALDGIDQLLDSLLLLKESYDERDWLKMYVLVSKIDGRFLAENRFNMALLEEQFPEAKILRTKIRQDLEIERAQKNGQTIYISAPHSKAAEDYMAFAKELLKKTSVKEAA